MELKKYVALHGQTAVAKSLGVSQGLVWQWINGRRPVSAKAAIKIEQISNGEVRKADLLPDIFGPDSSGDAAV